MPLLLFNLIMKGENTMNKIKKYIVTTLMALSMVLPIIQPLAVHAEETGNQHISISGGYIRQLDELESQSYNFECDVKSGYLIVGVKSITSAGSEEAENIEMYVFQNGKYVGSLTNTNKYKAYCENGTLNWTYLVGDKEQDMIGTANLTGSGYALPTFYLSKWSATGVSCNLKWSGFKVFETAEQALAYAQSGATDGEIVLPNSDDMRYSPEVPTPELVFEKDGGLKFGFNNASEDYCIEMKGRWWSVDDITLFKKNLTWKYSYESLIKNDLSTWVSASETASAEGEHDLSVYGAESFDDLLSTYPLDSRTYLGGSNAIGNFLFGYNDALTTLKMLLEEETSSYNSAEIYVRYYTKDDNGNYVYGKWCHWLGALANQAGSTGSTIDDDNIYKGYQSETGLTDDDITNLETTGNSRNDIDLKEETNGEYIDPIIGVSNDDFIGYFKQALDILSSLPQLLGEIPSLFGQIVSYLPSWIIACIGVGIVLVIILRIAGR